MSKGDYKVGYGRPPKHTRFVPGESGNKGRKKKPPELQSAIVARVRDECVTIGGVRMTMFEVAVRSVMTNTVKRGHPRELKVLFDLLEKHGAMPEGERYAEAHAAGEKVLEKIWSHFYRINDIDPDDVAALEQVQSEEAGMIMKCPSCAPTLRQRWNLPERKALTKRHDSSGLQRDVEKLKKSSG